MKLESIHLLNKMLLEGVINEAGLSRIISHYNKQPFAVLSGFRAQNSYAANKARNKQLESMLKDKKAGGIKLRGYWYEQSSEDKAKGLPYDDSLARPGTGYINVTEESFFIPMPDTMDLANFKKWIIDIMIQLDQDIAVFSDGNGVHILFNDGSMESKGTGIVFDKIGKAYSELLNKANPVPFVFEGCVCPSGQAHFISMLNRNYIWFND